ncbi:hypothetical protein [Myroides fluvii]|uniref:hypothetical protein n=1 Tax=Myroides fluvii TaxID=2572594 RepID=UPI00131A79D9|nr:hypothetical protein [Myroides fluvii]
MEELENKRKEYDRLKIKLDNVAKKKYGMDNYGGFPSKEKFNLYIEENKNDLENLKLLREQIRQLEWDLMTPEEQEREKEVLRLMREKREGKRH